MSVSWPTQTFPRQLVWCFLFSVLVIKLVSTTSLLMCSLGSAGVGPAQNAWRSCTERLPDLCGQQASGKPPKQGHASDDDKQHGTREDAKHLRCCCDTPGIAGEWSVTCRAHHVPTTATKYHGRPATVISARNRSYFMGETSRSHICH